MPIPDFSAQQMNREMLVGRFLSIYNTDWKRWTLEQNGDENIPAELHSILANIIVGLDEADDPDSGRFYLQALCTLSDDALKWLVDQVAPESNNF